MSALVQNEKYGTINTAYPTKNGYYIINFSSEPYTLQDNKTVNKQVIKSGELIIKA